MSQRKPPFWNRPLGRLGSVLVPMGVVGPGFVIAIWALYFFHAMPAPHEITAALPWAIPIFLVASAILIRNIMRFGHLPTTIGFGLGFDIFGHKRRHWEREASLREADVQQRLKRLRADPATRKYAELILAGQRWSDAEIAYDADPSRLVTCIHLQPIERAMRDAGFSVRLRQYAYSPPFVEADCRIDRAEFARQFSIQPPIQHLNIPGDRPYDPMSEALRCSEHPIAIYVVHPDEARPETPVFPAAQLT